MAKDMIQVVQCIVTLAKHQVDRVFSFRLDECVSGPSTLTVEVADPDGRLSAEQLLGNAGELRFGVSGAPEQLFSGIIVSVSSKSDRKRGHTVTAEVIDLLHVRCAARAFRAFEEKSVTDIVGAILKKNDIDAVSFFVTESACEARIQLGESDLDFVERLLCESGYFYYQEGNKLNIKDDSTKKCRGHLTMSYFDLLESLEAKQHLRHTLSRVVSYRYDTDQVVLAEGKSPDGSIGRRRSSEYFAKATGRDSILLTQATQPLADAAAVIQGEAAAVHTSSILGRSACAAVRPAVTLNIEKMPIAELNEKYFVVSVAHVYTLEPDGSRVVYKNEFECVPANTKYRPPMSRYPRPLAAGVYLGKVVAPTSGEGDPLKLGRVRVALSWMASEQISDPLCSGFTCWARVLQPHAGNDHGITFTPELGDHVLTAFEAGNPDCPVVLGALLAGDQKPPLPAPPDHVNRYKAISTRGGSVILFDDANDSAALSLMQRHQDKMLNVVRLNSQPSVLIQSAGEITVAGTGDGPIILRQGKGSISIDREGRIRIAGIEVKIETEAEMIATARGEVVLKGAKIKLN